MKEFKEEQLIQARGEYNMFKVLGEEKITSLKLKSPLAIFQQKMSSYFEELECVGFNPKRNELAAHIKIKRPTGYAGDLCSRGSTEYVRFYLDYGSGWEDQGVVGVNVHDIPVQKDCKKIPKTPLDYVVRLRIKPKKQCCKKPVIPKVRAILAWNTIPAPNTPAAIYPWGDLKEDWIQIEPKVCLEPINTPSLKIIKALSDDKIILAKKPQKVEFQNLIKLYENDKTVNAERFGYKLLNEAYTSDDPVVISNVKSLFTKFNINFEQSFKDFIKLKCNTNYEELYCLGTDYHNDVLVGTFKIKKPSGYNGGLCQKGSREYVSFWVQTDDCKWIKIGTTTVNVHDISSIPSTGLSYSAMIPFDLSTLKKFCQDPQILKVRAVLSWNTPPNTLNCSGFGNAIERYIQLLPRVKASKCPELLRVGGISVGDIDDITGLTTSGAKFLNQISVFNGSPFGGIILVRGISCPKEKYKVKITNLDNGSSYYLNNDLEVEDIYGNPYQIPRNGDVYEYQNFSSNPDNILARFTPSGSSLIEISVEDLNGNSSSQRIQLDNVPPKLNLTIDDNGNCTHYTKGDKIIGEFSIEEKYLHNYQISIGGIGTYLPTGGLGVSGTSLGANGQGSGTFEIQTVTTVNCGTITLSARQKTIINSAYISNPTSIQKTVCLG